MYCRYCGAEIVNKPKFCGKCGKEVNGSNSLNNSSKNPSQNSVGSGMPAARIIVSILLIIATFFNWVKIPGAEYLLGAFDKSMQFSLSAYNLLIYSIRFDGLSNSSSFDEGEAFLFFVVITYFLATLIMDILLLTNIIKNKENRPGTYLYVAICAGTHIAIFTVISIIINIEMNNTPFQIISSSDIFSITIVPVIVLVTAAVMSHLERKGVKQNSSVQVQYQQQYDNNSYKSYTSQKNYKSKEQLDRQFEKSSTNSYTTSKNNHGYIMRSNNGEQHILCPGKVVTSIMINQKGENKEIGKIISKNTDVDAVGIINLTKKEWVVISEKGESKEISPGKVVRIRRGLVIHFDQFTKVRII